MLVVLLALQSPAAAAVVNNRIPPAAVVTEIESKLKLPEGALPFEKYSCFYTEVDLAGRDTIVGQLIERELIVEHYSAFHKPSPPPVVRGLIADLQPVADGGCAAVTVLYDVAAKAPLKVACNPPGPRGR